VKGSSPFQIVTGEPNDLIADYHDRMPIAVADDKIEAWLDADNDALEDRGWPSIFSELRSEAHEPGNEQCQA
jgi:putative SOS response-associated peptidase YedK